MRAQVFLLAVLGGFIFSDLNAQNQLPNWLSEQITRSGNCIDNQTLVEICKAGPHFLEPHFTDPNDAYNAMNGTAVCLTHQAVSLSRSEGTLGGSFFGRSGAWADEIFVFVDVADMKISDSIEQGDVVFTRGRLPDGNQFYSNVSDNCFIEFIGETVEFDGF